ncbi:MAG: metallopeptidase family protein [Deltaproteobacteria bacterium]|nr:metallopeptidase family protein [Deltaproteobacteria bacterium]
MRAVLAVALVVGCKGTPTPEPSPVIAAPQIVAAATAPIAKQKDPVKPHREDSVVECPAKLAEGIDDDARAAALLEAANKQIALAAYSAAWTCADRAADLMPTSVEAHHLRGAALAAQGRDQEAQLAYSLALALDPDDPETLRAVADFYINGSKVGADKATIDHTRDALRLGLELAQRGSRRVIARRRKSPQLAADLAVLEAQALNDLGRSDEALGRVEVALRLSPGRGDAMHEKGVALFDLSKFADARIALERAVAIQPEDAFSHQILGLTLEALGDVQAGETELKRALELAPTELSAPVLISVADFRKEIESVIATFETDRKARVRGTRIEIADLPDPADLAAVKPPFPPTILGLYRGPVGKAHTVPSDGEPPSIVLYRKNLARAVKTRAELSEQIRDTLLHEVGHLEGLDEDDLRRRGME